MFRLLLICCLTLFLVACNPNTQAGETPQLIQSILSEPKTFNPVLSVESPNIFPLTFQGLVTENPITAEIEPALAESWEFSEDKLRLTFTLRQGLQWSDGHPLTVDDVVFSYNLLYLNPEIPSSTRDILRIGTNQELPQVSKVDDRRVAFTIPEPFAPFLAATSISILPAHILQPTLTKRDSEGRPQFMSFWGVDTPPEKLVANGPYQLESYNTSQRVIFKRNPYYWKKQVTGENIPQIERVIWQVVESTDTAVLQFRSGQLDALGISPEYFSLLKREENRGNFNIYNGGPAYGMSFISFNLNQGRRDGVPLVDPIKSRWFNEVNFRQAIAHAIDRDRMINNIFRGIGSPQNSPISVQSPFYDQTIEGYEFNQEKAKALLLQAGFKYNSNGELLDDQNNRVQFTLITNAGNKIREAMSAQIKEDLSKIGIKVDVNPIAFTLIVDQLSNSLKWECVLLSIGGGNEPNFGANVWSPDGNLHMFNQQARGEQDPLEGQIVSPWEEKIGKLYIEGARELDLTKRKAIYNQTQRLAVEYLPFIYLVNPLSLTAVRNRFTGIQYSALEGPFWNIEEIGLEDVIN
ncbi:ABC transporter substrate-binding protein [Gloeocapsa sp. PCC 73106]|uniref:ABC transporter substrate-binding protein n=1 Tax=Gloeocapsa sp. PCC 73106 TaxID=102232 RepID=UPI0002AC505B|nr:ABC transporter substrate-binding protein [Gloeocapsa sp. PCC 73106]ELR97995.1 ABC-type dipeptide transport system, periplasmic component [Gloeocapsa sp. PCC 73106]